MKYYIANWKMNMNMPDIISWLDAFSKINLSKEMHTDKDKDIKIIICPSFPYITVLKEVSKNLGFYVGSQDISNLEKGAHTGEVGSFQIKDLADYSIVGHSERKESLDIVINKRNLCLKTGITPIVCFVDPHNGSKLDSKGTILSWEDPNNISVDGIYKEKDPKDILEGINKIRNSISKDTEIIYGGSVNRDNIKTLKSIKEIDGVLVGNASLDPNHFADIINSSL